MTRLHEEYPMKGQRYLVVGSGVSGLAAARLLLRRGAEVFLYDGSDKATAEGIQAKFASGGSFAFPPRLTCHVGELSEEILRRTQKAVLSPGVPTDLPLVARLKTQGVEILGEIELGFLEEKGRLVAVTGTNGKTTTTALVGAILKAGYGEERVFVVGNIGTPYTAKVGGTAADTATVAEISSFQLETVRTFRPKVSAILNITPDHLNRHHTMEAYVAAKEAVAGNQTADDLCVLNYDDRYTRNFAARCPARVVFFSSRTRLEEGYYLEGEDVLRSADGVVTRLLDSRRDMKLVGRCNVENVMAAIAIAEGMGVPMDVILKAVASFQAVEHRIEFVASKDGVDYYNDSKATNPDAAIQGIRAMSKPTVLIAGGYDKQSDYREWIGSFDGKVKWLVLIGQTREKIARCAAEAGLTNIRLADSFEESFALAAGLARVGEAVLLSPACASWGMFENYEARGNQFKAYVHALGAAAGTRR
ncbi:MAG: UDP-N-acetylmuramoyl-L-alanine--D-glutamate ligase [Clostridium sp.]|jgi:UDP-N-acetylmuramoylalanine--D-glutamate ligase|nr:UDP-N-acetylmuramoyl-L-alanine--D-glutamate ligase [Clostridium sp.]